MQHFQGYSKPASFLDLFKLFIVRRTRRDHKLCDAPNYNKMEDLPSDVTKEKSNLVTQNEYLEIENNPINELTKINKDNKNVNFVDTEVIELSSDEELDQIINDGLSCKLSDFEAFEENGSNNEVEESINIKLDYQEPHDENCKIPKGNDVTFLKPDLNAIDNKFLDSINNEKYKFPAGDGTLNINNSDNRPFDLDAENNFDVIEYSSDDELDDTISYHSSDFEFIEESEAKKHGLYEKVTDYKQIKEHFDQRKNEDHRIPDDNEYLELFQGRYTPFPTQIMENKATRAKNAMFVEYNGIGFDIHGPIQIVSDELRHEAQLNSNLIRKMYPVENTRTRRRRYQRYFI